MAPGATRPTWLRSAAGFIATSTFGASPGVVMSWSEMWTWNADTPARVPAGARISAGKSGNVARSLPYSALVVVNRSPVSCMPSPESPAKRMMTRSTTSGALARCVVSVNRVPLDVTSYLSVTLSPRAATQTHPLPWGGSAHAAWRRRAVRRW